MFTHSLTLIFKIPVLSDVLTGGGGREGGGGGGGSLMTWINRKSKRASALSTRGRTQTHTNTRSNLVKTSADEADGGDS